MSKKNYKNKNETQSGFTLIELLIVISIIGLLASIILISLGKSRQTATVSQIEQDVEQISKGLELYHEANGQYPSGSYYSTSTSGPVAWSLFQQQLAPYVQVPAFNTSAVVFASYLGNSGWLVNYPNDPNTYCEYSSSSSSPSDHGYILLALLQQPDTLTLNDGGVFRNGYERLGAPYTVGLWVGGKCQ